MMFQALQDTHKGVCDKCRSVRSQQGEGPVLTMRATDHVFCEARRSSEMFNAQTLKSTHPFLRPSTAAEPNNGLAMEMHTKRCIIQADQHNTNTKKPFLNNNCKNVTHRS